MKEYILLTGASYGIGYEMANQLAAKKFNLILVVPTESELQQMQAELTANYGIEVKYFAADLSDVNAAIDLHKAVQQENPIITHLVNHAGIGNSGLFTETSLEEDLSMIQLNVSSLVVLTQLFAKDMVRRNAGRIMNVGSVLSFLPLPYSAVYSATKAFVLAFSDSLAAELEGTGISVTFFSLGTTDTDFTTNATQSDLHKTKPMHPKEVATLGVKHLLEGEGKKGVGF
ncbi:SDR family NAD(P)-dependent oxidoreductase [Dyadobacter pollutisoli]|uniref:SDR family NAD(P)-dependent oxidoreductase n=1 Tax=Dyadobacter pollutisoli TaxID=2910158 RepID=A0A9E8NBW7_9BACT|nr:SDR family NAD(P)-dependent oxidoreductase [Dyadobacter pollutisoli]WAC11469.1 SDR family NAD(P)-dependent oxidoreductase [Dyadobacter pollutisoli]